mmetsp:Transcript_5431/g.13403  ORF Transcript_5431/g.13403 Transcript_5431/m.13403 type:complete len:313 (+) Transcript_5431:560-1498(+)
MEIAAGWPQFHLTGDDRCQQHGRTLCAQGRGSRLSGGSIAKADTALVPPAQCAVEARTFPTRLCDGSALKPDAGRLLRLLHLGGTCGRGCGETANDLCNGLVGRIDHHCLVSAHVSVHPGSRHCHAGRQDSDIGRVQNRCSHQPSRVGNDRRHCRARPVLPRNNPRVHSPRRHLPRVDGRPAALSPGGIPGSRSPRHGARFFRGRKIPLAILGAQHADAMPLQVRGVLFGAVSQRRRRVHPGKDDVEVAIGRKRAGPVPLSVVQSGRRFRFARSAVAPHDARVRNAHLWTLRILVVLCGAVQCSAVQQGTNE